MEKENVKVLLIEDNPDDVELIKRKLSRSSDATFEIVVAKNLKEGLDHLEGDNCNIVVSDLGLPDSSGLDTVSKILAKTPRLPVVVLSGFDDESTAVKAVHLGAQDYLVKGQMEGRQMERSLFYAIERSRLQLELEQYTQELWKTETNLRKILEKHTDAILVIGADKKVLFANPAAATMLGRKQKELLEEPFGFSLIIGKTSEIEIMRRGGVKTIAEMRVVDITWEGRRAFMASLRDITEYKRAHLVMQKERNRVQHYLDIVGTMLLALDASGKVTMINRKGCEILECEEDDVLGKDWFESFIPADLRDVVQDTFNRIMSGEIHEFKRVSGQAVLCKNGVQKTISWNNSVVRDEDGNIVGTLSSGEDVTERARAEDALRESEERFSKSFRSGPQMMMITTLKDGRYVEINESYTRITGYTREEVIGRRTVDIDTWVDPADRTKILEKIQKEGRVYNEETRFRVKSGEIHIMLFSAEKVNIGGEPCLISVSTDITERKKTEEALKESEELFSVAFRSSPEAIVISTIEDGEILEANDTFLRVTGYTREEVFGKKSLGLSLWVKSQDRIAMINSLNEKGMVKDEEFLFRMKSGGIRTWLFSAEIIKIKNQRCMISVNTDITERKKAEESMRFSDAAFRSIHESVIAMDTKHTITHWNEISEQIYGVKAVDAIGKKLLDVIEIVESRYGQNTKRFETLEANGFYHEEELHRTRYGEVWVDVNIQAIEGNGKRYGWIMLATAITKRKLAEEAMKRSEEKYRELITSSHDGIVSVDDSMKILIWNRGAEAIFSYTEKEMLGQNILKIVPEDHRQNMADEIERMVRDRKGASNNVFETQALRKDGQEVPLEISMSSRTSDDSHVITAFIRDVTERKQTDEAIKRAAGEWRTTFDSINEMIAVVDTNHKVVRVNMSFARTFNMRPEEIIGQTCYQLFHGIDHVTPGCPLKVAISRKEPCMREYFEPRLGIYIEETTSPVFNDQGEVVSCVHVARNITERKKAEENLRKIDRMKMEFLSNVSHELRTPLQSIGGFTKLILNGQVPDPETRQEFLQIIDRESWHLGNLINDLLDMSRLESGRFQINRRLAPIRDTIADTLKIFHALAREKNIGLHEDIAPDLPEMEVDVERLRQVVINLLSNALKYSDPGSSITIKARKNKNDVQFDISDQGIGISPEAMEHLFERFYRAEDKLARGGTGLGLFITRQIVEAHGGRIWAKSKVGEGSTFCFSIPFNGKGGNSHVQKDSNN
jgi:PAS domain S-box-containing protein